MSLDWIYWAISWVLLRWHSAWDAIGVSENAVLGTNWSWILAIIFLVVTLRVILFPLFVKQIKSQRAMQALQPQLKALQEKHKGDRETLQKEMMELYRKEKANPLMGCLPIFLQAPVFIGLFHVLRRLDPAKTQKTLYGWSVEQFESATHARLFDVPIAGKFGSSAAELARLNASGVSVKILAGVLVAIMIATTYLTSRQMILKTGWAEDPQQRMIQRLMLYGIPASLLVSGAIFPIGVVIYWVTNNLFTLGQQQWVLRKYPPPQTAPRLPKPGESAPRRTTGAGGGAGRRGTDSRNPVQPGKPAKPAGRFGRSKANGAQPEKPAVDTKALAPKPGAKPVNPKKGRPAKRQG
ncbi:membrane protein insertase YidC [Plantactinospora sp. KLBMP9567]|uniref:membrane protein insertase YidC n=1 Tax=Plantactinospora sp. KLBMP9567 TaxID=3085900 RepID=UPI0029815461|nr:membrane protein insertase YidC [Plantactinospora sp. KLBMP9567]MDW5328480.1 membrane protein insertase YidC [Plantactinospora sp. KLBMP9567]